MNNNRRTQKSQAYKTLTTFIIIVWVGGVMSPVVVRVEHDTHDAVSVFEQGEEITYRDQVRSALDNEDFYQWQKLVDREPLPPREIDAEEKPLA